MLLRCLVLWIAISTVAVLAAPLSFQLLDDYDPKQTHVVLVSAIGCDKNDALSTCGLSYSVEAEVAHVYHLLIEKGIPEDNIITLFKNNSRYAEYTEPKDSLYDDKNFTTNWRPGLKIDYSNNEVNSTNFLAVIKGDENALNCTSCTRRVLKTTESDRIFIYHEGHGDDGVLYFSEDWVDVLTVKELNSALTSMQQEKKFNQLSMFVMACYSSSMFENNLNIGGNIFAVTAAKSDEVAKPKDCVTLGTNMNTTFCLNSEMGSAFVNDDTHNNPQFETMEEQFEHLRSNVFRSTVSKYGSIAISSEPTAYFQGPNKLPSKPKTTKSIEVNNFDDEEPLPIAPIASYLLLKRRLAKAQSLEVIAELKAQLKAMESERDEMQAMRLKMLNRLMKTNDNKIHEKLINNPPAGITAVDCHHNVMKTFARECPRYIKSPFVHDFTRPLVNLCEHGISSHEIISEMRERCH
ncbi:Legumain 1 [Aphelenchoides besseyi]|nr:Legumain 1 [Aphelenchoides besseyi]